MTDTNFDLSGFNAELSAASAALQDFAKGPGKRAADDLGASFDRAGERIARAMAGAATGGEAAFKRLVKVILEELAKIAISQIFSQKGSSGSFFGGKAGGGAVNVGGAYLVGERGPEMFVPRQAGEVVQPSGAVAVHFHLAAGADASAIARHQGQIAAAIARAVAYGRRNL